MLENPWKYLPQGADYVLPIDAPFVAAHNDNHLHSAGEESESKAQDRRDHLLQFHIPPVPFLGMFNAPVVLLLANPGYADSDVAYFDRVHDLAIESAQSDAGTPIYPILSENEDEDYKGWWRLRTRELAQEVGGFDELAERLLVVELHGYHSKKWSAPLRNFPSQEFGFNLVRQAMDRDAIIIAARCQHHWFASVPGLRNYEYLIPALSSPRSAHLSRTNLKPENFERVVTKLKSGNSTGL